MTTLAPPVATKQVITGPLLLVLAMLSAIAPFATDLYLSAFPTMTTDLDTSATMVQLTLTAFLVGIAAGQLVFGPLSDRFGRFAPLLIGAALCVAASAVAATAPTVEVLIIARLIQGITGAAGMVIGRAIISDLATGEAAARAFSLMMVVMGVAPVVAPFVGSLLVGPIGWRGILWVIVALAAIMLVMVAVIVRESHTSERRKHQRANRTTGSLRVLRSRTYLGYTAVFVFSFAVMMAYISASPFVYQVMMGLDAVPYGILFGVNALGLMAVSILSAKLLTVWTARRVVGLGLALLSAGVVVIGLLVIVSAPPIILTAPIFVVVSSLGLILGPATALALSAVTTVAGMGSAILGAAQFALAALVSPLVSVAGEGSAVPLAIVMAAAAVLAVGAFAVARNSDETAAV